MKNNCSGILRECFSLAFSISILCCWRSFLLKSQKRDMKRKRTKTTFITSTRWATSCGRVVWYVLNRRYWEAALEGLSSSHRLRRRHRVWSTGWFHSTVISTGRPPSTWKSSRRVNRISMSLTDSLTSTGWPPKKFSRCRVINSSYQPGLLLPNLSVKEALNVISRCKIYSVWHNMWRRQLCAWRCRDIGKIWRICRLQCDLIR